MSRQLFALLCTIVLLACANEDYDAQHSSSTCAVTEETVITIEDSDDVIIEVQETVVEPPPAPDILPGPRQAADAPYENLAPVDPQPVEEELPYCRDVEESQPGGANNPYGRYPSIPCKAFKVTRLESCD